MSPRWEPETYSTELRCSVAGVRVHWKHELIPFFRPSISETAIDQVSSTLRSGWLTTGPLTHEFERRFAAFINAEHAVSVNSCTAALHLALAGLGIGPGDEVIVPTMTFAATAEVVVHLGARPILVDCDPADLNIDVGALEAAITPRTRAIIPVHFGGQPAAMDPILEIAAGARAAVVEDAAHAFPASYKGRSVGTIGDVTCFSFYANKTITTGEGGMATMSDARLADRVRMLSLHGLSRDAWTRYSVSGTWDYDIQTPGYKYNLTDLASAIGIDQLGNASEFLAARKRQAETYRDRFSEVSTIRPLRVSDEVDHAWHLYVLVLEIERLTISRNEFIDLLKAQGIGTSVHYRPLHLHSYYQRHLGYRPEDLPAMTDLFPRLVSLPIYPGLSEDEQDRVAETVVRILREHTR